MFRHFHKQRAIAPLGILFLITFCFGSVAQATNLVNPGFENGTISVYGWKVDGSGYEIRVDGNISTEGNSSLRVEGGANSRGLMFQQIVDGSSLRESPMKLRAAIRTEDIAVSATAFVIVYSEEQTKLYTYDMRDRVIKGTESFSYYEIEIPPIKEASTIAVGGIVIGSGTAWFDDFHLKTIANHGGVSEEAAEYLEIALNLIHTRAIGSGEVNWDSVVSAAYKAAAGAHKPADTHTAIRLALSMLPNSNHMSLIVPAEERDGVNRTKGSESLDISNLSHNIVNLGGIGYFRLPSFKGVATSKEATAFIDTNLANIESVKDSVSCGWIIDLTGNSGGNMWVQLAAVSAFMTDGIVGMAVDRRGNSAPWIIEGNAALTIGDGGERVSRAAPSKNEKKPIKVTGRVVVMIDDFTASAAEAVALALRDESATTLIGSESRGLTTANISFPLTDGAFLVLSVADMATRTGIPVVTPITPEIITKSDTKQAALRLLHALCDAKS